jgi:hypothetical protein
VISVCLRQYQLRFCQVPGLRAHFGVQSCAAVGWQHRWCLIIRPNEQLTPPTRLRPGRTLRVKACNPRQPGPMGQGPTSTPSPVRQFSHQSCRDLSCTRSHANLCWYLPRPFRTVRQLSSGQQTAVAEVALFNRRHQLCLWLVLACLDDCGDCFRVHG